MADTTTPPSDADILNQVALAIPDLQSQIENLDHEKKPFSKKLSKHKSSVRKILKRKLEELQDTDPTATAVVLEVGNTAFRMEEVVSYPPCKPDDMITFFSKENVEKYMETMQKKRLKMTIE